MASTLAVFATLLRTLAVRLHRWIPFSSSSWTPVLELDYLCRLRRRLRWASLRRTSTRWANCIKQLWAYIRKHNLQVPENKQYFTTEKKMAEVFDENTRSLRCFFAAIFPFSFS